MGPGTRQTQHCKEWREVAKILGVFMHGGFKCDNHVDLFSTSLLVEVAT